MDLESQRMSLYDYLCTYRDVIAELLNRILVFPQPNSVMGT